MSAMASYPPGFAGHSDIMDALQYEYEDIMKTEERRNDFIQKLMHHIQSLSTERDAAVRKRTQTEFTCDNYQKHLEDAKSVIKNFQKAADRDRFVLLLIDGDTTLFLDDYVKDGFDGGERAARDLYDAVFDYLKDKPFFQHDFKIIGRIYLNLQGLAKTYQDCRIITNLNVFHAFTRGFNKTHEQLEIVDAGNVKEAADTKIKACFNLYRNNLHCKHILLAGSGDSSYSGFLSQFQPTHGLSQDVTLIEALPFAKDLILLSKKFPVTSFEHIFSTTKLEFSRHAVPQTSITPPPELRSSLPSTYAKTAVVAQAVPYRPVSTENASPLTQASSNSAPAKRGYWQNANYERLDKPIKDLDKSLISKLKELKLCNRYHLVGDCDGTRCTHSHEGTLSPRQLDALRYIARSRACYNGLQCTDPECCEGHQCASGSRCSKKDCWFTDMHGVDMSNPKWVPFDDTVWTVV